jgi:hypothetical protein
MSTGSLPPIRELQAALAIEQWALYLYGVIGARLTEVEDRPGIALATAGYRVHRSRRDSLTATLVSAGEQPVPAEPGYLLPDGDGDPRRIAVTVEERVCAAFADLAATARSSLRQFAARIVADAAVRGSDWGGAIGAFPGLPERRGN